MMTLSHTAPPLPSLISHLSHVLMAQLLCSCCSNAGPFFKKGLALSYLRAYFDYTDKKEYCVTAATVKCWIRDEWV